MTTFALWEFHILRLRFVEEMPDFWQCMAVGTASESVRQQLLILRQSLRALESWDEERGCCIFVYLTLNWYVCICIVITVYEYVYEYWDVWPCAFNKHGVLDDEWWYVFQDEVEPAIVACRGARFVDVSMIAWAFASTNQATPALMEEVQWKGSIRGWGRVSEDNI